MRARTKRVMRNINMSATIPTPQANPFLPPGAPDPNVVAPEEPAIVIGEEVPHENAEYPAATLNVTDEETHKAQVEAETKERMARAKRAGGPRRLSEREKLLIGSLLELQEVKEALSVTDVVIPIEALGEDFRLSLFEVGNTHNIFQRGLVDPVYDGEPKAIVGFKLREVTMDLYSRQTRVGNSGEPKQRKTKMSGEPKAVGGRRSNKYEGLRLRKMVENPRDEGTMGYFSWQLYRDGMTYSEYMATKDYPQSISKRTGEMFRGPGLNHWTWDLEHGFTALYRDGQEELNEDGTPNPNYWVVKNIPLK